MAILAFLGQVVAKNVEATDPLQVNGFVCPLIIFGVGVFCAVFSSGLGYLAQISFHEFERKVAGDLLRWLAVFFAIGSYACFLTGLWTSGKAFTNVS